MELKGFRSRILLPLALVVLAALLVVACGDDDDDEGNGAVPADGETPAPAGDAPDSILIGAVVPLTGAFASGGELIRNGYELAVEDINAEGGVMVPEYGTRIPLELTILDDASDPTNTVARLETLAAEDVYAYLGGFGSSLHAAAAAIAEKNQIPYLGVAFALNSVHQQGYQYLFSPFPKSPALAESLFDMMDSLDPQPQRIAIFAESTDWGAELSELWNAEAQERGYEVVVDEDYAVGASDLSPMILAARDAGAEVVLSLPIPPDGLTIVRQMKELNFNPALAYFVRAADPLAWSENLGTDGDYALLAPGWSPDMTFSGIEDLKQKHMEKYGTPAQAVTGPAYAAVKILADAISRAESLDQDAIRDALAETDYDSPIIGPVTFNDDGTGNVVAIISQWQNGETVVVWPPEQATTEIAYPAPPFAER